ncbi:MAG: RagB/SusD family nutrient uptake outer membrane protein [Chitinophagaceae bacterium]
MKKFIKIFLILFIVTQLLPSCKKTFLDEQVQSSYAPETLTDSLGLEASIAGLQNRVTNWFSYSDNQGWLAVWQVGTDIAYTVPGRAGGFENPYGAYATLTSTDGAVGFAWRWAYEVINNANGIIGAVENPSLGGISQASKNSFNAEARFFRAYAYNILATCFGKVPIIKESLKAPKTDFVRATVDEVNSLLVEDLTFASTNLPAIEGVKSNSKGKMYARANKTMAQQLLAEVYLRMGKNDLAEAQCTEIINNPAFSLVTARYGTRLNIPGDAFSDMFRYGNQRRVQGNKEALWVIEFENPSTVVGGVTNSPQQRRIWGAAYHEVAGMKLADSLGGRTNARLRLSNWLLYNLYDANDMRNSQNNIRRRFWYNLPGDPKNGQQVPFVGTDTLFRLAPHTTKWYQFDPADEFGFAMIKDIIVMRLGETYLLRAEAQFKQNKKVEAAASINAVRARANAAPITDLQVTLDFILDERVRELVAEENRRMTLMRTGTLVTRATTLNGDKITGLTAKNLLLPIPQAEINLNIGAPLGQNDGY